MKRFGCPKCKATAGIRKKAEISISFAGQFSSTGAWESSSEHMSPDKLAEDRIDLQRAPFAKISPEAAEAFSRVNRGARIEWGEVKSRPRQFVCTRCGYEFSKPKKAREVGTARQELPRAHKVHGC